jgi:endonuclease-8
MIYNHTVDLPQPYNKIGDGPEGPEARTLADIIKPKVVNTILLSTYYSNPKYNSLASINYPTKIINVRTFGKKIIMDLESKQMIIFSLGMTGKFLYTASNHSRVQFSLANSSGYSKILIIDNDNIFPIYFDDIRMFGGIDVITNDHAGTYFSTMGPDLLQAALTEQITLDNWLAIFTKPKWANKQICQVLLEQSAVAGIGNYLKSEILYYAHINPKRLVSSIAKHEWEQIRVISHHIILLAYKAGGNTIENFITPEGTMGNYQCSVYNKKLDPAGNPVVWETTKDTRTTYWVPSLQF